MIETAIISALIPAAIDIGKGLFNGVNQWIVRKAGGVIPTTIAEVVELEKAEIAKLEALAKLDNPSGTPSQWVVDFRACFRYVGALVIIASAVSTLFIPAAATLAPLAWEAASAAFFFVFGERMLLNMKK